MCQAISPALYRKPALFNRPYREPLTTVRLNTVVVLLAPKITHVLHARPLCMSHTKQQSAAHSPGGYDEVKLYPTHAVCVLQWPQEDTSTCLLLGRTVITEHSQQNTTQHLCCFTNVAFSRASTTRYNGIGRGEPQSAPCSVQTRLSRPIPTTLALPSL